jgi:acetyl esterase/lipase
MPLDRHAQRLVQTLALAGRRGNDVSARRDGFAALLRLTATDADTGGVSVAAHAVPSGPRLRLYGPDAARAAGPGLVFLHGGGFVCGDLDTHDALCRALAATSGCRVLAVDYRRAPEHVFPAALEDAIAALGWALAEAPALGIDPACVGIVGESAGAALAVAATRELVRAGPGRIALQVLLCPILDWAGAVRRVDEADFLVDRATIAQDLACYLPAGQDPADPRVSPLRAGNFAGLPPALIHTAECDPLSRDGAAYAAGLRAAGVPVRHTDHAGMVHLFHAFGRAIPGARAALTGIGAQIAATFVDGLCEPGNIAGQHRTLAEQCAH